jgi:hypothetical protein
MFEISPLPLPPVTTKAVQGCLSISYEEGGEKSQTLSCNNRSCPGLFKYFIGRRRGEISNKTWTASVVTGQCLRFLPSLFL